MCFPAEIEATYQQEKKQDAQLLSPKMQRQCNSVMKKRLNIDWFESCEAEAGFQKAEKQVDCRPIQVVLVVFNSDFPTCESADGPLSAIRPLNWMCNCVAKILCMEK